MQMNRHQSLKKPSIFIGDGFKLIASMFGVVFLGLSPLIILRHRNRRVPCRTIPRSSGERTGLSTYFIGLGVYFCPDVVIFVTIGSIIVNIKRTIEVIQGEHKDIAISGSPPGRSVYSNVTLNQKKIRESRKCVSLKCDKRKRYRKE